jgi:hypothetical protein
MLSNAIQPQNESLRVFDEEVVFYVASNAGH